MKLLASLALLGFATLLTNWWLGMFSNIYAGAGFAIAACLLYGFIYDRARESKRRSFLERRTRD